MTHTISLNSVESLPIPPRSSSRNQDLATVPPLKPSPLRDGTHDNDEDGGSDTSPSPSLTPRSNGSRRSSLQKRKAIPPYLPPSAAMDLPADHPFSSARIAPNGLRVFSDRETSSIRSGNSGSDVGTPGWREEKDLFFASQNLEDNKITSLPPPPRKSNARRSPAVPHAPSPAASITNVPISLGKPIDEPEPTELPSRRGTFAGGLNIDVPGLNPQAMESQISTATATSVGYETARTGPPSIASQNSTPTPTPHKAQVSPEKEQYYDRPLPPIPRAPSTTSLGMESILAAGPAESLRTRSESVASRPSPTTPRLSQTNPTSPMIRGLDNDNVSSIASAKGFSALGGKKFPWQKKSKKHRHGEEEDTSFSVSRVPSQRQLWEAGTHFVRDEDGKLVYFGDLFPKWDQDSSKPPPSHTKAEFAAHSKTSLPYPPASSSDDVSVDPSRPPPRTVLFFIRFFWCGQCQDYLYTSVSQLDPEALEKANIRVVIISNGSWKFIKSFRKLTRCPFPVYVDGPRKLYKLMGMKQSVDMGFIPSQRGQYNQHSVPVQTLRSAVRLPLMPMTSNPGNLTQLGGEFILEPGFVCSFAHRMTTFSNHMEAPDILRLAGCPAPTKEEVKENKLAAEEQAELERLQKEMNKWRTDRESELDRIRRKKAERRGVAHKPLSAASRIELNLDGTPAFGPTNGDRRESAVSAMSFMTAKPDQYSGPLDVSLDEAASGHTDEVEVLEGEMEEQRDLSDDELDMRFEQALKMEDEAKGRFEASRSGGVVV